MHPPKLVTTVAILATAAGFSALAGTAQAQISGTIGGDYVVSGPPQTLGDRDITLTDGHVAVRWGISPMDPQLAMAPYGS